MRVCVLYRNGETDDNAISEREMLVRFCSENNKMHFKTKRANGKSIVSNVGGIVARVESTIVGIISP